MVLLEFSMSPLGKGESVSEYVSRCVKVVEECGLPHQTHAMGTLLEGEWDEVMDVVRRCYEVLKQDCPRVSCSIKMDIREGRTGALTKKLESLEKRLGKKLT